MMKSKKLIPIIALTFVTFSQIHATIVIPRLSSNAANRIGTRAGIAFSSGLPQGNSSTHNFIYDISGEGLLGDAVSLEILVTSLNGNNLEDGAGNGLTVIGGSNDNWWESGENLSFSVTLKDIADTDVTSDYTIDLISVEMRWKDAANSQATFDNGSGTSTITSTISDAAGFEILAVNTSGFDSVFTASRNNNLVAQLNDFEFDINLTTIPEPRHYVSFVGIGLVALCFLRRR